MQQYLGSWQESADAAETTLREVLLRCAEEVLAPVSQAAAVLGSLYPSDWKAFCPPGGTDWPRILQDVLKNRNHLRIPGAKNALAEAQAVANKELSNLAVMSGEVQAALQTVQEETRLCIEDAQAYVGTAGCLNDLYKSQKGADVRLSARNTIQALKDCAARSVGCSIALRALAWQGGNLHAIQPCAFLKDKEVWGLVCESLRTAVERPMAAE